VDKIEVHDAKLEHTCIFPILSSPGSTSGI
jgi:hypothetical protein